MLYLIADRFENKVKEVKALCFDAMGAESTFMELDDKTLALVQKSIKLLDTATELTVEQAKTIDKLNAKIDKLLEILEKQA